MASSKPQIHFIGIGGIGMSGLARYYKAQGCVISGSDSTESSITAALHKEGIKVKIGHSRSVLADGTELVIYNRAILPNNPELVAAHKKGIRTIPYAEALGELTEEYSTIAITGSHGKTTTTALAALTLIKGGFDPTVLVGTNLKEFAGKNVRFAKTAAARKNGWLVLEADDFGGAFWAYSPAIAIVTNVDREHLDFYKNLNGVKKGFLRFLAGTIPGGTLILNADDPTLRSLKADIDIIAKKKELRVIWYSIKKPATAATVRAIKKIIKIHGEHNLSNAMAVRELAKLLKIPEKKMFAAIGSYHGAWRRMEYRGDFIPHTGTAKIPVYDDYAHHPTEIVATLQGLREKFPHSSIACVFQPHQAKRLKALFEEFTSSFAEVGTLVLIPSYAVAGRDESSKKFTSEKLAQAIAKKYPNKKVYYVADPEKLKSFLNEHLDAASGVLVMMGAGDIVTHTDKLIG